MTHNPIAKAVTRIRPQVVPDKRGTLLEKTVRIEIRGGCLANVSSLPPGWDYELIDYDNADREKPEGTAEEARAP